MTVGGLKKGDIVTRKSYGGDIFFVVNQVEGEAVFLSGLEYRLEADAPPKDLEKVEKRKIAGLKKLFVDQIDLRVQEAMARRKGLVDGHKTILPGRVFHIDGDEDYLRLCLAYYHYLGVPAQGMAVAEDSQPLAVSSLLTEHVPDILVLTGHDGLRRNGDKDNMEDYRSSNFFADAVRQARQFQSGKDNLVIIAGACQSNFEALIAMGANFASAPQRIFIHALDPVFAAEKVAYTHRSQLLEPAEVTSCTVTGRGAFGGIETKGCLRYGD